MKTDRIGRKNAELTEPQNDEMTGRKNAELTLPRERDTENEAEVITPDMIANMTQDEFSEYLGSIDRDGSVEEQPEMEPSEAGTESGGAVQEKQQPEADAAAPYRSFASKEEYEADRDRAVNEAFSKRFRNTRERDELLNRIERSARRYYKDSENPIEDMLNAIDEQAAAEDGISVDDYRTRQQDADELERYRSEKRLQNEQQQAQERIINEWKRGEAELKSIVPGFELRTAMQDGRFIRALLSGSSVAQAYLASQYDTDNGAVSQSGGQEDGRGAAPRREIAQNAQTANRGTGETTVNPASMPEKDFAAYINRISGNKLL